MCAVCGLFSLVVLWGEVDWEVGGLWPVVAILGLWLWKGGRAFHLQDGCGRSVFLGLRWLVTLVLAVGESFDPVTFLAGLQGAVVLLLGALSVGRFGVCGGPPGGATLVAG